MTQRKIDYWVIPPKADGEFVAAMEEVLETYAQPYDSKRPVLCMDEQPIQLLKETRVPIAATKDHPRRVDYEYERAGNGEHLHVLPAAVGLAGSDGAGPPHQDRLGGGTRSADADAICIGGESDPGLRQPQHAHQGRFL